MGSVLVRQTSDISDCPAGPHSPNMEPAADEHEGGLQTFSLSKECVVKHGKFTWVPTQKVEQEIVWFCINKWDRHFVRFCTGKALDLRSSKSGASVDGDLYMNILVHEHPRCSTGSL